MKTNRDVVNVEQGLHELENLRLEPTRTRTTRHPEAKELDKEADLIEFLMHTKQQDEHFGRPGKKLGSLRRVLMSKESIVRRALSRLSLTRLSVVWVPIYGDLFELGFFAGIRQNQFL